MFDNIGGKIKVLAKVFCWIGIISSAIYGIFLFSASFLLGLVAITIGALLSWISSFTLYGLGELIERACEIAYIVDTRIPKNQSTPASVVPNGTTYPNKQASPSITCPVCNAKNSQGNRFCIDCGANLIPQKPSQQPAQPVAPQALSDDEIICPACGTKQKSDRKVCWSCGTPFVPVNTWGEIPAGAERMEDGKWVCPKCGRVNAPNRTTCWGCE